METDRKEITIRDLKDGFEDNRDGGVVGYGGALDIRPPYQREFVYKDQQRDDVIGSIVGGFPLGLMYWTDRGDGKFEVLDGQQRTISICMFIHNGFSFEINGSRQIFENLDKSIQERILDYPLLVYACKGEDSDLMRWFERINMAGAQLTTQEIRNAVYHGPFVTEMKRHFTAPGAEEFDPYMKGQRLRQGFVETGIEWIAGSETSVNEFMSQNRRNGKKAKEVYNYAKAAITWAHDTFGEGYDKSMAEVDWGGLYRVHGNKNRNLAQQADELRADIAVTNRRGIYPYLLSSDEDRAKHLNVRYFSDRVRQAAFKAQGGKCAACGKDGTLKTMDADHITAWSKGGPSDVENCQMLCKPCNMKKGNS